LTSIQSVALAAQDAVERPEVEAVLPRLLQLRAVELHLLLQPGVVAVAQPPGHRRVRLHLASPDLVGRDLAVRAQRAVVAVQPEGGKEDLVGEMGVESAGDVGEPAEVGVDEARDAVVVLERAAPRAPAHVEGALREAEVLLHVDEEQVDLRLVRARGPDPVARAPGGRFLEQLLEVGPVTPVRRPGS
jgi:hypothetical protein